MQVHKTFRSYESVIHAYGIRMSIKQTMCPSHLLSLYEDILVTKEQWMKIWYTSSRKANLNVCSGIRNHKNSQRKLKIINFKGE